MKRFILAVFLFALLMPATYSQIDSYNYVLTATPKEAVKGDFNPINSHVRVDYFNDLGWPVQSALLGVTPSGKDLVNFIEYDLCGRKTKEWIATPMVSSPEFLSESGYNTKAIAVHADANPYERTSYDPSPLGRVTVETGAGQEWHNNAKGVRSGYYTNETTGKLQIKKIDVYAGRSIRFSGYYSRGHFLVNETVDEDGHTVYQFVDKRGKTRLSRSFINNTEFVDTYYIYDTNDRLRFVLPPLAADALTKIGNYILVDGNMLDLYAYLTEYDGYGRLIYSKSPGVAPAYFVYDKVDRCILTQDGNLRKNGQWKATLYDIFDRVVYEALVNDGRSQASLQSLLGERLCTESYTGNNATYGYSASALNLIGSAYTILSANYYDNYRFLSLNNIPPTLGYTAQPGYGEQFASCKDALTGNMAILLDNGATLYTSHYYDKKGREVQTLSQNHLGGIDRHCYLYSFTGNPLKHSHEHTAAGKTKLTELYTSTYDHAERPLTVTYCLNNGFPTVISSNTYDEHGRLANSRSGGYLQTYSYNIRSWLTSISGDYFQEKLTYAPYYNGNISECRWKSPDTGNFRMYLYNYDGLNRLAKASYGECTPLACLLNHNYDVEIGQYDKQGNILQLIRRGLFRKTEKSSRIVVGDTPYGIIDNLALSYKGNQLKSVSDASPNDPVYKDAMHFVDGADKEVEYTYDSNGNLLTDLNKQISGISYNFLDLANQVSFTWAPVVLPPGVISPPSKAQNQLRHSFDSQGTKHNTTYVTNTEKLVYPGGAPVISTQVNSYIDYCENLIYENGVLSKIMVPGGYYAKIGGTFVYHFLANDHQGNVRAVGIPGKSYLQLNHYYPFGGLFGDCVGGSVQRHKYAGKELDRMNGLDWYDFSTRGLDPVLARFGSLDPMREKFYSLSPYAYCGNNPVNRTDPSGMDWYGHGSAAIWREGSAYGHRIDGVDYFNMGSTFSCTMADGSYLNYYQNVLVSVSNANGDAYSTILTSPKLQIDLLGNASPLSKESQTGLLSSLMNTGRNEFAKDALEVSMYAMTAVDGISLAQGAYSLGQLAMGIVAKKAAKGAPKVASVAAETSTNVLPKVAPKVHGNSLKSTRPTWGYKLYSKKDGTFLKNGITSQKIPERRYTKGFMEDKKMTFTKQFPNRKDAWDWEYQQNLIERGPLNKNMH